VQVVGTLLLNNLIKVKLG